MSEKLEDNLNGEIENLFNATPSEDDEEQVQEGEENEEEEAKKEDNDPDSLEAKIANLEKEAAKWKAFSRKHEREKAALAAKAQEEGNEDVEALRNLLKEREAEIAEYKQNELVGNVLKEHSLPEEARTLLKGSNEEELEASALALKALLAPKGEEKKTEPKTQKPKILSQGSSATSHQRELTVEEEALNWLNKLK